MSHGAIILCGGRSSRMRRDKALLPFGPDEVLLQRVVRNVAEAVPAERIVCVAAAEQTLPELSPGVRIVRDEMPDRGPLAGLAVGVNSIGGQVSAVLVCGCDSPFLTPPFVSRMFSLLAEHQIVVARHDQQLIPLPAIYRTDVLSRIRTLLADGERSLQSLVAACNSRIVDADELRDVDPDLAALANCNTPEDYERAVARAFPTANSSSGSVVLG